jgi:poly(A) polymerase
MTEAGLLVSVIGGVPLLASMSNMMKLEIALALVPDPVRRLAALAVNGVEDAERLRERLRLANVEFERTRSMADGWWHLSAETSEPEAQALLYRLGPAKYCDRVMLAWSRAFDESVSDARWRALVTLPQRWHVPVFPLKAADFIARGVTRGPALGSALRTAEADWIAEGFPMGAAALARIAARAAGR